MINKIINIVTEKQQKNEKKILDIINSNKNFNKKFDSLDEFNDYVNMFMGNIEDNQSIIMNKFLKNIEGHKVLTYISTYFMENFNSDIKSAQIYQIYTLIDGKILILLDELEMKDKALDVFNKIKEYNENQFLEYILQTIES